MWNLTTLTRFLPSYDRALESFRTGCLVLALLITGRIWMQGLTTGPARYIPRRFLVLTCYTFGLSILGYLLRSIDLFNAMLLFFLELSLFQLLSPTNHPFLQPPPGKPRAYPTESLGVAISTSANPDIVQTCTHLALWWVTTVQKLNQTQQDQVDFDHPYDILVSYMTITSTMAASTICDAIRIFTRLWTGLQERQQPRALLALATAIDAAGVFLSSALQIAASSAAVLVGCIFMYGICQPVEACLMLFSKVPILGTALSYLTAAITFVTYWSFTIVQHVFLGTVLVLIVLWKLVSGLCSWAWFYVASLARLSWWLVFWVPRGLCDVLQGAWHNFRESWREHWAQRRREAARRQEERVRRLQVEKQAAEERQRREEQERAAQERLERREAARRAAEEQKRAAAAAAAAAQQQAQGEQRSKPGKKAGRAGARANGAAAVAPRYTAPAASPTAAAAPPPAATPVRPEAAPSPPPASPAPAGRGKKNKGKGNNSSTSSAGSSVARSSSSASAADAQPSSSSSSAQPAQQPQPPATSVPAAAPTPPPQERPNKKNKSKNSRNIPPIVLEPPTASTRTATTSFSQAQPSSSTSDLQPSASSSTRPAPATLSAAAIATAQPQSPSNLPAAPPHIRTTLSTTSHSPVSPAEPALLPTTLTEPPNPSSPVSPSWQPARPAKPTRPSRRNIPTATLLPTITSPPPPPPPRNRTSAPAPPPVQPPQCSTASLPSWMPAPAPDAGAAEPLSPTAQEGGEDEETCVVCFTHPRQVGLLHGNTMHACLCKECAQLDAFLPGKPCPICRVAIVACIEVYK